LSHEDARRLAAIERQMLADDPALVRRFRRFDTSSTRTRRVRGAVRCAVTFLFWATIVIGSLLAGIGALSGWGDVFLPGCVLLAAAWWLARVRRRRRRAG
jgi:hypothetical protein